MTFCICFRIHTPPASPYPSQEGTRSCSPFVSARVYHARLQLSQRQRKGNIRPYKRHGGSVPFRKGCHDSGGVCITLAEPAYIVIVLLLYGLSVLGLRYIPPGFAVPLSRGDSRWQSVCLCLSIISVEVAGLRIQMTVQASRRQRPLSKGVPREWRGMYNAGGASIHCKGPF